MSDNLKKAIRQALNKVAERIRDKAIDEAPFRKGILKKSITVHDERPDRVIVSAGDADAPYAPFVHEGTRPHLIKPKNKKALSWKGAKHPSSLNRVTLTDPISYKCSRCHSFNFITQKSYYLIFYSRLFLL